MGAGLRYYKKVFINARQTINPTISSSVSTPTKVISLITVDIEVGHKMSGYKQQQWPWAAHFSFLYHHHYLQDGAELRRAWSLPVLGTVQTRAPCPRGPAVRQRRRKRNRECRHLCSVPEEVQHKARGSIQILLESVEAFQVAGIGARAWLWQILKVVGGKVMECFRKQGLKYGNGICWTLGKSASKVFVKCHLKNLPKFTQEGCGRGKCLDASRDLTKQAW